MKDLLRISGVRELSSLGDNNMAYYSALFDQGAADSISDENGKIRIVPEFFYPPAAYSPYSWYWYAIRYNKLGGTTPHFLIDKAQFFAGASTNYHLAVWGNNNDSDTWTDFDNITIGTTDIEFYNNDPFPSGSMIYIALAPMYPFIRTMRKVQEWSVHPYVTETLSTSNKIIGYATARPTQDSRIASTLPYYGFKISKPSSVLKNKMILAARQHPGEIAGGYALEGAVDWLLGGSDDAELLLNWFDIFVYPCVNPQGVNNGYSRSNPENRDVEPNHTWVNADQAVGENVAAFVTAMDADTGGEVEVGIDYHSFVSNIEIMSDVYDQTNVYVVAFHNAFSDFEPSHYILQEQFTTCLHDRWRLNYKAHLTMCLENGAKKTRTVTTYKNSGKYSMQCILAMSGSTMWHNSFGTGARVFNGTTDRIDFDSPYQPGENKPLSISLWLYLSAAQQARTLWAANNSGSGIGTYVWMNGLGSGRFSLVHDGTTDIIRAAVTDTVVVGSWNNYIATWDGSLSASSIHLYRNGIECSYSLTTNGSNLLGASGSWSLGGWNSIDNWNLSGSMAQFGAWNRVIQANEIAGLAAGNSPKNYSTGLVSYQPLNTDKITDWATGGSGTFHGTTLSTLSGPSIVYPYASDIGSRRFNSISDNINWASPHTPGSGSPLTVSMWVNLVSGSTNYVFWGANNSPNTVANFYIWSNGAVLNRSFTWGVNGSTALYRTSVVNTLPLNTWTHLLSTWDGTPNDFTKVHLYLNGNEVTYNGGQNGSSLNDGSGRWAIGGVTYSTSYPLPGKIAQVGVWNSVVDANTIAGLASGYQPSYYPTNLKFYFRGNTPSLVEVTKGLLGVASGTTFVSGSGNGPTIVYS